MAGTGMAALTSGRDLGTRVFALMWALGGALVAAEVVLLGRAAGSAGTLLVLAASALAIGLGAWRFRHALPLWVLCVGAFLGVVLVTAAVVVMGEADLASGLVLLYLWTSIFAFVFFPPVMAWSLAAFTVVCHALVVVRLSALPGPSPLVLGATVGVVGFVVGRSRRCGAVPETDPPVHPAVAPAEQELARAIERHELVLDWQPTVDLRTGRLSGFEALVRWDHPARGRLGPATFIPLAEQTGLIQPLGRWVLDEACRHAAAWEREFGLADLTVAVNVSGHQLESDAFIDSVRAVLARSGVPARCLTLEVTESTVATDVHAWKGRLAALRAIGVRLAMDDFGTGYSSLSQLRELPFSTLKVDRSFILELGTDRDAQAMVAAVIRMAAELGKQVVFEGVETPDQLSALHERGGDLAQGYLLGGPASADAARQLVGQHARGERPWRAPLVEAGAHVPDDRVGDTAR